MTLPQPSLIEFSRIRKSIPKKVQWTGSPQSAFWRRPWLKAGPVSNNTCLSKIIYIRKQDLYDYLDHTHT